MQKCFNSQDYETSEHLIKYLIICVLLYFSVKIVHYIS